MNTIKTKINSFINYAENNTIKVLPTLQDIRNIREFVPVAIRQYRITKLGNKIHKLQRKKDRLVDINVREFMNELKQQSIEM